MATNNTNSFASTNNNSKEVSNMETKIREAVEKYCSDYHCPDTDVIKYLTNLFIAVGTPPTPAQAKIILSDSCTTSAIATLVQRDNECTFGYLITQALIIALRLREPCFLNTFIIANEDNRINKICISKYLLVCTTEAARNTLKNVEAYRARVAQLKTAYHKRRYEVYEYAMHNVEPDDTFYITNAYRAAWYIIADDQPIIELTNGKYSAKQLKDALNNVQTLDRYAMVEYIEYDDIISEQAEILHRVKAALFKVNAQMHVFHNSFELADEGISMGNCIATYWDHDNASCLFSVDYKGEHMDVELIKDEMTEYTAWIPSQVMLASNKSSNATYEIEEILDQVCMEYNNITKANWIATFKPNKNICRQACNRCDLCVNKTGCPASPYFGADEELINNEALFDDEDLEVDDEGFDFEPRFVNEDDFDDDDLTF